MKVIVLAGVVAAFTSWKVYHVQKRLAYAPEDSQGLPLHPLTRTLGSLSRTNSSRNWWQHLDKGPDSGLNN